MLALSVFLMLTASPELSGAEGKSVSSQSFEPITISDGIRDETKAASSTDLVGNWNCSWSNPGSAWKNGKVTYQQGGRFTYRLQAGAGAARFDVSGSGTWKVQTNYTPKKTTFLSEKHVYCEAKALNEAARRLARNGNVPCASRGQREAYIVDSVTRRSLKLGSDRESVRCSR